VIEPTEIARETAIRSANQCLIALGILNNLKLEMVMDNLDKESLKQRADSWDLISELLSELEPNWIFSDENGQKSALNTISKIASERDAMRAQLETTQRELTATTISRENALSELDKAREQKPAFKLGYVYDDDEDEPDPEYAGDLVFYSLDGRDYERGAIFYAAPVPAMPIQSHGDADAAFANYLEGLGGVESNEWHDAPVDGVFKAGFAAGQRAMPMQDDRIAKEWQEIWNPIDELVRPLTPLGHSVAFKAVELIKQALAMPIPKQEPEKLYVAPESTGSGDGSSPENCMALHDVQEPAGAVPDGVAEAINNLREYLDYECLATDDRVMLEGVFSALQSVSPRITEQDAREILSGQLIYDTKQGKRSTFNAYLKSDEGRALLDKLNANAVADGEKS
jgi:hypothetical protein